MLALVILLRSLLEISAEDWRETFVYSRGKKKNVWINYFKKKMKLNFPEETWTNLECTI